MKLQHFRTQEGVLNDNDGVFIETKKLTKVDKEDLKEALETIDDITQLIKTNTN